MPNFAAVDVEDPVRAWLGVQLGRTIFASVPPSGPDRFVTLSRIGGGPEGGHLRIDAPLLTVESWARTYDLARELATDVVEAFESIPVGTVMGGAGGIVCLGAEVVLGPLRAPELSRSLARYVVDVVLRLRPA